MPEHQNKEYKQSWNDDYLNGFEVLFVKEKGKISSKEYQELNTVSKATAFRDLSELVEQLKIFERKGEVGAGTSYSLIGS